MAFLNCNIRSEILGMDTEVSVILPYMKNRKDKIPVLYLLHGLADDNTRWCRMTSVERYVRNINLAVVMPNVHRSFYLNTDDGRRYFDFVNMELPEMMENMFNLGDRREDKFVAGASMGGYGAMKLALSEPYQFGIGGAFSGALDFNDCLKLIRDEDMFKSFKKEIKEENDLFVLIERANGNIPSIYQACGTEDYLYAQNIKFRNAIEEKCGDFVYNEESGKHEWGFWDKHLQLFIEFIKERNEKIGI